MADKIITSIPSDYFGVKRALLVQMFKNYDAVKVTTVVGDDGHVTTTHEPVIDTE